GDTVEVGTVLAVIGAEGEHPTAGSSQRAVVSSQPVAATPVATEEPVEARIQGAIDPNSATPQLTNSGTSTEIVMQQMGESITEGTVSKWLKAVGEKIDKDEALLEISTDKVDAEVPSPESGTLLEIVVPEGETVEVGAVLARVGVS